MNPIKGNVARLSRKIRGELNQRLERSEKSPKLLTCLNGLPKVQ